MYWRLNHHGCKVEVPTAEEARLQSVLYNQALIETIDPVKEVRKEEERALRYVLSLKKKAETEAAAWRRARANTLAKNKTANYPYSPFASSINQSPPDIHPGECHTASGGCGCQEAGAARSEASTRAS